VTAVLMSSAINIMVPNMAEQVTFGIVLGWTLY
jgi:hypothetical protein